MRSDNLTIVAVLAAVLLSQAAPCRAQETGHALIFHSHQTVTTWEENGVRVFVAPQGADLRQDNRTLTAPRMVVWFDRARSSQPDVKAAMVRVYAEGQSEPVLVTEGEEVSRHAAALLDFTSKVSFVWDCPLRKLPRPQPSGLLAKARKLADESAIPAFWDSVPAGVEPTGFQAVTRTMQAEQVEVFWDEYTAVYIGDVHGDYGNLRVRADEAVLWYDRDRELYEIYARGDVRLMPRPGVEAPEGGEGLEEFMPLLRHASADELYINPMQARALATEPELRVADPRAPENAVYVVRGETAFMVDSQTLGVQKAAITTCPFARPHYQFAADRAQIVWEDPSTFVSAWDIKFQVGEEQRTLLHLPFLATDISERAYLITDVGLGSSDKFDLFLQTTWSPLDLTTRPAWLDRWEVYLDWYTRRGPALGTEVGYEFGSGPHPLHQGTLRAYYVNDEARTDDTDLPVPRNHRGRTHLHHRSQLNEDWRLDAEYYWLSDEGFLNEYFESEFEEGKVPESYVDLRYLRNSLYMSLLFKEQVNDFLPQLEQQPGFTAEVMGLPLGRFVYEGTLQAGTYDFEPSDLPAPPAADPPDLNRIHMNHRVSLPFSLGIFRLDPSVRALATWAGESAMTGGTYGGAESRTGVGAGVTASTTLSRIYPANNRRFKLNRLRHVLIPHMGFETLSTSGAGSGDFIQMDRVDSLDSGSEARIGLRQTLQTKRLRDDRWQSVNWMELDAAYVMRSSDSVDPVQDEDFLRLDFDWLLTDHVSVHSRDNVLAADNLPDVYNFGAAVNFLPRWLITLDYDHIEDVTSTVTATLECPLSARYRLMLLQQQELDAAGTGDQEGVRTQILLRRILHEWNLDFGIRHDATNDDFGIVFGFGPRNWGIFQNPVRAPR